MVCSNCLEYLVNKLRENDLIVLEYLKGKGAVTPQFSLSRKTIQDENELSIHITVGSLHRLSILDFIGEARSSRATKYHITEKGINAISIIENKINQLTL